MDNLSPEHRRKNMQNIKSSGTKPELLVARELRRRKIYFSKNVKTILGKPDFVFRRKKIVLFVDSDFWHGHPTRCVMPKSNKKYWNSKIKRNRFRDKFVNKELKKQKWRVYRIWEYDLKKNYLKTINKIIKKLK